MLQQPEPCKGESSAFYLYLTYSSLIFAAYVLQSDIPPPCSAALANIHRVSDLCFWLRMAEDLALHAERTVRL